MQRFFEMLRGHGLPMGAGSSRCSIAMEQSNNIKQGKSRFLIKISEAFTRDSSYS